MSNPLGNFAAAAASAKSGNPKISSAELLSMLKKPTVTVTPTSPSASFTVQNASLAPQQSASLPATVSALEKPIEAIKDDYSLQSLVNLIKACPADRNIFSIGVDLERTGLAFNQSEPLRESLHSPWFDGSFDSVPVASDAPSSLLGMNRVAGGSTSGRASPSISSSIQNQSSLLLQGRRPSTLDSIIPDCYTVPTVPAPAVKISSFADETLFYIFYAMPGDRMQDLAARELNARNWRFHKTAKTWICPDKETNSTFMFDQTAWIKVKRSISVFPGDIEEPRSATSTIINTNEKVVMHGSGTLQSQSVTH